MNTRTPKTAFFPGTNGPEAHLSSEGAQPDRETEQPAVPSLDQTWRDMEAERARLANEVVEIKADQQQLLEHYFRLEEQNSTLTTLYVACQRLHSTLDRTEVLLTVREIIVNLIGCEEFALFTLLPDGRLRRVDSLGLAPGVFESLPPGSGLIARTVQTGEVCLRGESDSGGVTPAEANLTACIPLKRDGTLTGAIALFRLLPQKFEIQELDRELFRLLETHLALALHCAELHERARSKNGVAA
jgi:chorismate mutase